MTLNEAIKHEEEIVKEEQYEYQECVATHNMEGAMNCRKYAEEHRQLAEWLKELKQLREQTRWIPVSERLPKEYEEIIVTDVETSDTYLSRYIGDECWECDNGLFKDRIIAWQPKPEPYKAESKEV